MNTNTQIKHNPLISVVMATFNGERFIGDAIDSILNQTFTDFEFIIIDDGSTDETANIIHSFNDQRIIYIKKEINSGIADSLNLGIKRAKGIYIARMDDDDVCMPYRFKEQLKIFSTNKNLIFCGSNVSGNDGKPLRAPERHNDIFLELLFRNPIFHPTAMIKKDVLLIETYKNDSVPSEDYELWSRLIFSGEFYQIQEPLLFCRIHQTSVTARRRQEQLQLSVSIVDFMFRKLGFDVLEHHDYNLKAFVSHDYSIKGANLRKLVSWFNSLKELNADNEVFSAKMFNKEADKQLNKFLISYFTNRSVLKKIMPFFNLKFTYKLYIINYYLNKLNSNNDTHE